MESGSTPDRFYHINYGWGWGACTTGGCNTWYQLDAIFGGNPNDEYLLENIYPHTALGNWLSGTYLIDIYFPHRYFDQDASGDSATFEGQFLHFLPNITVTCTSTTGGSIRFTGDTGDQGRLFARGDITRGVRIYRGAIKLNGNGSIKLR